MFRRLLSKFGFNKPKETILPQTILVPETATQVNCLPPRVYTSIEDIVGIRHITTASSYKLSCNTSIDYYEKKYAITLNKVDCMTVYSSVWFALDLWKQFAFVRCAIDINDGRTEFVFQIAIINDQIQDFTHTLNAVLNKNSFSSRTDIATVGTRSYALIRIW